MRHRSVIGEYLAWTANELGSMERRRVEQHLERCEKCREYYRKMTLLLERPGAELLPRLTPDPLPTGGVRRAAAPRVIKPASWPVIGWARVSIAGATLALALAAGIYLGNGLSKVDQIVQEGELAEAYYEAFSPSDFAGSWESLVGSAEQNGEEETNR